MATIREYFDTDMKTGGVNTSWQWQLLDGSGLGEVVAKIAYDFSANARYWYFFVPNLPDTEACIRALVDAPQTIDCKLGPTGDGVTVEVGFADYSEKQNSTTLVFTGRVNVYVDADLTPQVREALNTYAAARGLHLAIRDAEYARRRSELEKPMAFLSHDSRDKDSLVRELASELSQLMCPVWYDEYSLKVGDSLRASIEKGLKETRRCVVVLSPAYLSNSGWGKAEFDSIFTREIIERKGLVLPVWHEVSVRDVYEYSPRLADKVGLPSSLGVRELARRLSLEIKAGA